MKVAVKPKIAEEDVVRLRAVVMRLGRELRKASTEEGLTATQSAVLAAVVRNDEVPLSELAGAEGLNPTMLSRVVGYLEDTGLVLRVTDANDRRAARVRATAHGKKLVQRLRNRRTAELMKRVEALDEETLNHLVAALPALEQMARINEDVR